MLKTEDLERARATYIETRDVWLADSLLDAHERLALITVAAGIRRFAFLNHLRPSTRKATAQLLFELGLHTRILSARFDIDMKVSRVRLDTSKAYERHRSQRERFFGLGVSLNTSQTRFPKTLTITQLGSTLEYPSCCVAMDVGTKQRDNELFLRAIIKEFGDDPIQVDRALRRKCAVPKASYGHLQRWDRRYQLTLARFPFVLHTGCDKCLNSLDSPTSSLNTLYERLARDVSDELHFLVRWAAHIGCRGRDQ